MRCRIAAAALLQAVSCLSGCAQPVLSADPRIVVRADSGVVVDTPLHVSVDGTGMTHVSIELHNPGSRDVMVSCVVDWFDGAGHPAVGLTAFPTRVAVAAFAAESCETVSPSPATRTFRAIIGPAA